jgi:ribosomal protein S18 acetylase RimI-like enzyme
VHLLRRHLSVFPGRNLLSHAPLIDPASSIVPRAPATHLRLAGTADEPFVRQLYRNSRASEFAAAGLPQAALDVLLDQQYRAQAAGYAAQFPDAMALIVLHHDEPVGRLILQIGDRQWRIVDILLLAEVRGQGIGSDLIDAIRRAASERDARELCLAVRFNNVAARRLYARLGFAETADGVHIEMCKDLTKKDLMKDLRA